MSPGDKTITLQACPPTFEWPEPKLHVVARQWCELGTEYRFLVNGKDIKYVTVHADIDQCTDDELSDDLKHVWPAGDWQQGFLGVCRKCYVKHIKTLTWLGSPAAPTVDGYLRQVIEQSELAVVDKLWPNVQVVTCSQFPGRPLVFKYAAFPQDRGPVQQETEIYGWLRSFPDDAKDIAPIFVAHVCTNNNIIGFLIEHVSGRAPRFFVRGASASADKEACQKAIRQLHALGIKHGNVKDSILIRCGDDGNVLEHGQDLVHKAFFTNFWGSTKCTCKTELEKDFDDLNRMYPDAAVKDEDME